MKRVIKRMRTERGLTQSQLAEKTGLSIATIQGYEQGKFSPRLDTMFRFCNVLDLPLDELIDYCREDAAQSNDKFALASWAMAESLNEIFTPAESTHHDNRIMMNYIDHVAKSSDEKAELYYRISARLVLLNKNGLRETLHHIDMLKEIPKYIKPDDDTTD